MGEYTHLQKLVTSTWNVFYLNVFLWINIVVHQHPDISKFSSFHHYRKDDETFWKNGLFSTNVL